MLHAELHGKVGDEGNRAEHLEDVLTSTVFGTLFVAGTARGDAVLRAWLARATAPDDSADAQLLALDGPVDWYGFWPRLSSDGLDVTEPDLLLRFGPLLVILEAKFRSNESGDDQLTRQWSACATARTSYGAELRGEIEASSDRLLVYLVRRKATGRARRFIARSLGNLPGTRMLLLTWEDLDAVLRAEQNAPRWCGELRAFFRHRGIAAFNGFAGTLAALDSSRLHQLAAWRATKRQTQPQRPSPWRTIVKPDELAGINKLATWRPRFATTGGSR